MHKGFTLIELLIVILIISLIYFLGFSGVELDKKNPKALTPLNLKSTIINAEWFHGHATLICVNKCRTCLIRQNVGTEFQKYPDRIALGDIKVYTLDADNALVRIKDERYDNKKICLKMDFYNNGSSTQLILKNDEASYFLPAFFDEPKVFDSIEAAKEYWLESSQLASDTGDFY